MSTTYRGKLFTYCLSIYGSYLWFLGLPQAYAENEMEIQLKLEDPKAKTTLWQSSYKRKKSTVSWIYAMQSDFYYDMFLKDIMNESVPNLRAALTTR